MSSRVGGDVIRSGGKSGWFWGSVGLIVLSVTGWGACRMVPKKLSVCEIQGSGLLSPYQDQEVITRGLVSYLAADESGFALLDSGCLPAEEASRGIYITLEGGALPIQVGDEVQVRGTVREVAGETRLETALEDLEILSLGNPQPGSSILEEVLTNQTWVSYESLEGQLVNIPRAEILQLSSSSSELVILPRFFPESSQEMVCFQSENISLRLSLDRIGVELEGFQPGDDLQETTGLLRQDQTGYLLVLVEEPLPGETHQQTSPESSGSWPAADSEIPDTSIWGTSTPTGTASPSSTASLTPSLTPIPSPTYYPIRLLITELLPNPAGEEPGGEWVEIFNPTGRSLPLDGIKLGDEISPGGKEGMVRFPDGYRIGGQEVLVIANRARNFKMNYGFQPDFELEDSDSRVPDMLPYPGWGRSVVQLNNSVDEVLLVSPWDQVLDLVVYGSSSAGSMMAPVPKPAEGHSLERYPPEQDRDRPEDWRERSHPSPGWLDQTPPTLESSWTPEVSLTPVPIPTLTPATPGFTPTNTASAPDPSLTETGGVTPAHTSPPSPSSTPLPTSFTPDTPLPTLEPTTSPTPVPTVSLTPTVLPLPSSSPSPEATLTPFAEGTPTPGHTPTTQPTSAGTVTLTAVPSPSLSLTPSPTEEIPFSRTPAPSATETPSITPSGTISPSSTITLTPVSSATATLPGDQPPVILINEILADPDPILGDSNGDGQVNWDDDEFLELVNISETDLVLDGWTLSDEVRVRYTFPEGTSLTAGCGLVLFGGGTPRGDFGGSLVFTAGSLGLNNTGDEITLRDADSAVVASCSYGAEGGENQSLTRYPDLSGGLPLVLHSQVPEAAGALYSPGNRADGNPFGDCP